MFSKFTNLLTQENDIFQLAFKNKWDYALNKENGVLKLTNNGNYEKGISKIE